MSTLTSSPSPAASPRSSFHLQSHPSNELLTRSSPRLPAYAGGGGSSSSTSSAKRTFHAPQQQHQQASSSVSASRRRSQQTSITSSSSNASVISDGVVRPPPQQQSRQVTYVHAGTQYSPEGLPPTAGRTVARATVEKRPPGSNSGSSNSTSASHSSGSSVDSGSGSKKRKEREQLRAEEEEKGNSMAAEGDVGAGGSSASAVAVGGAAAPQQQQQPPSEPASRVPPSAAQTDGSSTSTTTMQTAPSEPQEARSTHGHSSAPKRSRTESGSVKTMPQRYWTSDPKDLGVLISSMLMELIRLNDQIPLRDGRLTRFHSRAPPGISVSDYLQRLIHHATLSPPILLSMVWYIDRLCQLYPAFTINSLTVHRFLITAATVAAKGLSDSFWTNPTYARIGGIPVSELATLELEFLQKVQWKIVPKPEVLEDYYRSLVDRTEGYVLEQAEQRQSSGSSSEMGEDSGGEMDEGAENENEGGDGDEKMADEPT